jgi:pyrroloquinoline quinone biosynthesis protein E
LTGDAANADPVCDLSPYHHLVTDAVARADRPATDERRPAGASHAAADALRLDPGEKPLVFRSERNSSTLFVKREST